MTLAALQAKYGPAVSPGARGPFSGALYKAGELLAVGVPAADVVTELNAQTWRWAAIGKAEQTAGFAPNSFRTDLATLT